MILVSVGASEFGFDRLLKILDELCEENIINGEEMVAQFGEHIDNHQLDLCKVFSKNSYTLYAKNKEELIKCIKRINEFEPRKFESNKRVFNDLLMNYIKNN